MRAPESYSIVVPTYQDFGALGRTLSNLILCNSAARDSKREIIVVGDGHEDEAAYVCGESKLFAAKLRQNVEIRYEPTLFHHGNGNIPRATGLEKATGDWVLFIDAGTGVVRNTFEILNITLQTIPREVVWLVWDCIHLVDPIPLYSQSMSVKITDKSNGLPYCMPGISIALERKMAQSIPWPDELESDWAYTSQQWDALVAKYGVEEAEKMIEYIPAALTIAYAHKKARRYRQPTTQADWAAFKMDRGWNSEKSWLKQDMGRFIKED